METKLTSASKEVIVSRDRPSVLIGERINPTGKKKLMAALKANDLKYVQQEAISQVEAGADVIDVNVAASGVDEIDMLPRAIEAIMEVVDAPICIDSPNTAAIAAGLKVYKGKPLINSVSGEEKSLKEVLPLVKEYGAAVVGLVQDDDGVPPDSDRRVAIAHRIVERCEASGIPREDVIIDCLALAVAADSKSGLVSVDTISRIREELGVNITLGTSNISFGLPNRQLLTGAFAAITIAAGVTCLIVDAAKVRPAILAADLVLGNDNYAQRYISDFRRRQKASQ